MGAFGNLRAGKRGAALPKCPAHRVEFSTFRLFGNPDGEFDDRPIQCMEQLGAVRPRFVILRNRLTPAFQIGDERGKHGFQDRGVLNVEQVEAVAEENVSAENARWAHLRVVGRMHRFGK